MYDENAWNRMLNLYVICREDSGRTTEEKKPIDIQKAAIGVSIGIMLLANSKYAMICPFLDSCGLSASVY